MKATLKALFDQLATINGLKWYDEDFGQIDIAQDDQPAVKFPCALVTVNQQHTPLGGSQYDVKSNITIRVAFNRLGERPAKAGEAYTATLNKLDVADAVLSALEGYEVDESLGQLYIVEYLTEARNDGLMVKVIKFTETHQEGL
jgi:hypothetical protein